MLEHYAGNPDTLYHIHVQCISNCTCTCILVNLHFLGDN